MAEIKICPYCQIKYPLHIEVCEKCGRPLYGGRESYDTTDQVAKTDPTHQIEFLPSVEELGDLAKNTLVLFVKDKKTPILLENIQEVVLGRPMVKLPNERTFDLTNYGAMTLGVSRRHVRITNNNQTFRVLDLDSTNGTSLNGRFLPPGQSQQLQPYDKLMLGQLELIVYFKIKAHEQGKSFLLTDNQPSESWSLTLTSLTTIITPYIQALAEIQYILWELSRQPYEEVKILHIQLGERFGQLKIGLLMADGAIDIIRQWVGPWQLINLGPELKVTESNRKFVTPLLRDLVASITNHLLYSVSGTEASSLNEKLFDPISLIATSGLELMLESHIK